MKGKRIKKVTKLQKREKGKERGRKRGWGMKGESVRKKKGEKLENER